MGADWTSLSSVLLFCGPRAFAQAVAFGTGNSPASVAVGDFNGDGLADIAVANSADNTISVLLAKPDGSYHAAVAYAAGATPSGVTAADLNGDGKLDLVVANKGDSTISVLLGNGDGTFKVKSPTPRGA